jgi:hypothetical protein
MDDILAWMLKAIAKGEIHGPSAWLNRWNPETSKVEQVLVQGELRIPIQAELT